MTQKLNKIAKSKWSKKRINVITLKRNFAPQLSDNGIKCE